MPSLMFLSGLLLMNSLKKRWAPYILGKLGRIGGPYLVRTGVWLALAAITSRVIGSPPVDADDFVRVFYAPNLYLWYLAYLQLFYVVCLFLPAAVRSAMIPVAVVLAVVIPDLTWVRFFYLFAFFLLGDFVARNARILPVAMRSRWTLAVAGLVAVGTGFIAAVGGDVLYEPAWMLGSAAGIIVLVKLAMLLQQTPFARIVAPRGSESLIFYTTHWVGMAIMINLALVAGIENAYVLFALGVVGGLGIGFSFYFAVGLWRPTRYLFELPLAKFAARRTDAKTAAPQSA